LPLSTTLASSSIFKAFLHPTKKVEALLHGHSYTANPIACSVSLTALKMVEEQQVASENGEGAWREAKASWLDRSSKSGEMWSFWDKEFIDRVSRSNRVQGVMTMGTVVAIELKEEAQGGFGGAYPRMLTFEPRKLKIPSRSRLRIIARLGLLDVAPPGFTNLKLIRGLLDIRAIPRAFAATRKRRLRHDQFVDR
jgi:dethiobiotin synthetase/adenosylmethionine--8-amino-7-oxononanoate aminotransferase